MPPFGSPKAKGRDRQSEIWHISTDASAVTTKNVVLGTNALADNLWLGLNSVFTMIRFMRLATALREMDAAHILPARQGLRDTGQILFNFRRDAHDCLQIRTMGRGITTGTLFGQALADLRAVLEVLDLPPPSPVWR